MSRNHVLFVGFALPGSLAPFWELAKKISKHHDVTFAVSAACVEELRGRGLPSDHDDGKSSNPRLALYGLEDKWDPSDMPGQLAMSPNRTASGDSVTAPSMQMTKRMEAVREAVEKLMRGISTKTLPAIGEPSLKRAVDVAIVDFFMLRGSISICEEQGIPFYIFSSSNALVPLQATLVDENTPTRPGDQFEAVVRGDFDQIPNANGEFEPLLIKGRVDNLLLPMRQAFMGSRGVILNSVREFEKEHVEWMERSPIFKERPLFCVAPLMPHEGEKKDDSKLKIQGWLDRKKRGSVVYVAFGSLVTLRPEQLTELGKAIENLGRPYIWSLLPNQYPHLPKSVQESVDNWDGDGLVLSWVPQKLILAHDSVGVFVSHSGLNSTVESLAAGKPMVCCPVSYDHLVTAQSAVQHGVGVLIGPQGFKKDAALIPAKDIEGTVRKVQEECRQKASEWRKKLTHAWDVSGTTAKEFNELATSISNI
ncbi:hypothetical protein RvY_10749 [Ramazzottius varieornatus]|uniref:UDP-glucuronosyltransferase n=1 Tax=Ramazzottius varieornatus TaxID=947166 RepID=A0A1D1VDT7_RAMVA|nr:hypothetical protein RvY_10749 [Ramazzottius varieornatus]